MSETKSATEGSTALAADGKLAEAGVHRVVIHPLVLLSAVDHYRRKGFGGHKKGRVIGVLLGEVWQGRVDCTNCFALPFAEQSEGVFFVDADYLAAMYRMFYKVNAKEKIVGFYTTGNAIRANDIHLEALFRQHCGATPVMAIIDVDQRGEGLPLKGYVAVEVSRDGRETKREFQHIQADVEAYQAEEVGVEHLLRDVNDPTVSSLAGRIKHKLLALASLRDRLAKMAAYLAKVSSGSMEPNHEINALIQRATNLIANLSVSKLTRALNVKANDLHMVVYVSSLVRAVLSLHDLLHNKLVMLEHKKKEAKEAKEKEMEKAKQKEKGEKKSEEEKKK